MKDKNKDYDLLVVWSNISSHIGTSWLCDVFKFNFLAENNMNNNDMRQPNIQRVFRCRIGASEP